MENKIDLDLNRIYKNPKGLALKSNNYNSYMNNYLSMTQKHSFKLPEITMYPIFKNKNLISLSKHSYNVQTEFSMFSKMSETLNTLNTINSEKSYDKWVNFKINNKNKSKHTIRLKKVLLETDYDNSNDKGNTNLDTEQSNHNTSTLSEIFKKSKYQSKDVNLINLDKLLDLEDPNYFNVNEFFLEKYRKSNICFLKRKIEDFIIKKTENFTEIKTKNFLTENNGLKVELALHSMEISFFNKTTYQQTCFQLPFNFLCIFYYMELDYFKTLISKIFNFDETFEKITLEYEKINETIIQFSDIILNSQKFDKQIKESCILIDWLTPNYVYEMKITFPFVEFKIKNKQSCFVKTVDKELMIYVMQNNFIKWDYYILSYLKYSKIFRSSLNSVLKYNVNNLSNNSIFLNNFIVIENKKNPQIIDLDVKAIDFFISDKNRDNNYYILRSSAFEFHKEGVFKKVKHEFTLRQMINLSRIKDVWDPEEYLARNLTTNNKTIKLDTKSLDSLDDNYLNYIKQYPRDIFKFNSKKDKELKMKLM